jgi:hypothetical protein
MEPTTRSILGVLSKPRLVDIGRRFSVAIVPSTKELQVEALAASGRVRFRELLAHLGRDELKAACRAHKLDDSGRARTALAARLMQAHGMGESAPPAPLFGGQGTRRDLPRAGDIALVRHRHWMVEAVVAPPEPGQATAVELVCLDDDNQGRALQVLWELELGARVLPPEAPSLRFSNLDSPRHFAAYLHALKWSSVTATDAKLFQAPFRAGIKLLNHQLTPLKRALSLPHANLFIADDVGLGKTIEAGLVLQELQLRQRVDFVLILCPASIALQWRSEMEKRFGQRFEIYNRDFVAQCRMQRGFGVNPWTTHNRFIVSYQTVRRPEHREPLEAFLGARLKKSLLVLDEAHTAAPATASKYAVDSQLTKLIRSIAPKLENRLFLSATPHNGHSNSFSALMEILDPQRFTRGVDIAAGSAALKQVMVRRLKRDLQQAGQGDFPVRKVIPIHLSGEAELTLSTQLAEYTQLMKPDRGSGRLVFINLQKRLLSSIEAFYRTLQAHAARVAPELLDEKLSQQAPREPLDEDTYGKSDDSLEQDLFAETEQQSAALTTPAGRARELLTAMLKLAKSARLQPDAKVNALLAWMREHQCKAVHAQGAQGKGKDLAWSDTRVILFTEYGDTKRYLTRCLSAAIEGTRDGEDRILGFHGAMSDKQRALVQQRFNGDPEEHPVRILIATDAAREGLNLQSHCQDLFHFDIPWNPARMEQRNGRIDRTLQPKPEVRCHYFLYPERAEDAVLQKLVEKVDTIQRELGSLGEVVLERITRTLEGGITQSTAARLDEADRDAEKGPQLATVRTELESQRESLEQLRIDTDESGALLNRSAEIMDFRPELLRDAVDVGLALSGAPALKAIEDNSVGDQQAFALPELPKSWEKTLDSLRPPRGEEPEWEWRKRTLQSVVFRALDRMDEERVHLHLEHPFVRRILSRFLAQGYSAHDLQRVTVIPNPHDNLVRVIAFGRLSLFGSGAARLHDRLVSVAAQWLESKGDGHLRPFAQDADRKALERLEDLLQRAPELDAISAMTQQRLAQSATADFAVLWPHVRDEADHLALKAEQDLALRGQKEAEMLREILRSQRALIQKQLGAQLALAFDDAKEADQLRQFNDNRRWMEQRLRDSERELETEPEEIEALYRVSLKRLEPVGLVYLWPHTRS